MRRSSHAHVGPQRQRLSNCRPISNGDSEGVVRALGRRGLENGLSGPERGLNGHGKRQGKDEGGGVEAGNDTENEDNENNENDGEEEDEEEEDDNEGPLQPFHVPCKFLSGFHEDQSWVAAS